MTRFKGVLWRACSSWTMIASLVGLVPWTVSYLPHTFPASDRPGLLALTLVFASGGAVLDAVSYLLRTDSGKPLLPLSWQRRRFLRVLLSWVVGAAALTTLVLANAAPGREEAGTPLETLYAMAVALSILIGSMHGYVSVRSAEDRKRINEYIFKNSPQ